MLKFSTLSKLLSHGLRVIAWMMLVAGCVLGMAWAALHFWIVPRIEDFRPKLENLATQTIGVPVQMGKLLAVSSGWMPTFEIHDLALLDPEGRRALTLPKIVFAISVRSILDLGVEQLVIDSPTLDIRRTSTGEWRIAGLSLKQDNTPDSAAADWIFAQKEIVIQHGTVFWTDEFNPLQRNKSALDLQDVSWILRNSARHHQWRLDATPPSGWGDRFVLMGDLKRNLLSTHPGRFKDWSGQVHAEFPDVDLSQLGPHLPWKVNATKGQGALRMWVDLNHGNVKQATADLVLENVQAQLSPELQALSFKNIAGRLSVKPLHKGLDFSTEGLRFDTTDGLHWPGGNVNFSYAEADNGQSAKGLFHGDKLDLFALRNIALQLPLPESARKTLLEHKVSGLVNPLHIEWSEELGKSDKAIHVAVANGRFDNFYFEGGKVGTETESWPSVENANISFDMNADGGQIKATIDHGAISIHRIFEEPRIQLDAMQASVKWVKQKDQVTVPDWQLRVSNSDVTGEWQGKWKPSPIANSLGILDLQGTIARGDAARVHRYLPLTLPQSVRHYVRDSVLKGEVQGVAVKIKGDLQQLPFANPKDGEFRFAGKVKDIQYAYVPPSGSTRNTTQEPNWPAMNNVNGDIVFDRYNFKVNGASGKWGNVPFTQIKAEIPNLNGKVVVNVQGESKTGANLALTDLRQSPVNNMLGGLFAQAQSTGTLNARLKLSFPLAELDKTTVQGNVSLNNNDVRLQSALPLFEKAQGNINFNESGFSLVGVNAQFLGGPIKLDGGSRKLPAKSTEANPLIRIQGQATANGMRQAKEIPWLNALAQQANGSTTYTASLGFKGGQSELSIQSQLQGLALNLPSPLNKRSDDMVAFKYDNTVQSLNQNKATRDQIQMSWGRALSASYVRDLTGTEPRVINGRWQVGDVVGNPSQTDGGVLAIVNLPSISLDDWLQILSPPKSSPAYVASSNSSLSAASQTYLPNRMTLKANELTVQGRNLHNVSVNGSREGYVWRAQTDAREFSGYLEYRQSNNQNAGRIYARLARLSLPPSADQTVESLLEDSPVAIPALDIVVEDLELRGKKMGRVEIEAINTDPTSPRSNAGREWRLSKLNITVPEASFKASGKWVTSRDGTQQAITDMNFRLDVSDSGDLLNRLGTKDALRGGGGKLEGQVSWQGSPLTLHYPTLGGRFNVNIGRGQFLQAEPGVAKLLGVLSLQALPRRLLLDFRDVFSAGFAFDTIRGDVTIQQGIANTRNLQMKGVNAIVQMEGSSDIARETQNLRVLILPEVDAGTASLLAGIALNPAIGLSTFLAQLVLKQPLSRVNTQEFSIDGTWSDPKVTKISSSSATP
ncbi:YhdP family protein [Limnohabitans sp. Hippo4]|uniref:YhdP family protein n=1 Tax=Limnohabitans sp. Hippo4 TaxID=1826167 RepID=UPI000D367F8A|nr:YhdP family protein [Limnohabitans sp. Hippo4]PUE34592.1 TIGR02099 family protein [Limnohabitans sp. Hippo4]